ncbi:peptide deformylase [Clostridia bacterium]|nr:peptide deformylase [Clostridia bacterium]
MALRNVLKFGDETLRKTCKQVEKFDRRLWQLLDDLHDTLTDIGGVGLAAPQVGILRRVCIVELGPEEDDGDLVEMINPTLEIVGERTQRTLEGCLSSDKVWGYVMRPYDIIVKAQDRFGNPFEKNADELLATAIFHEVDHLDGILFSDKADEFVDDPEEAKARMRKQRSRNRKKK